MEENKVTTTGTNVTNRSPGRQSRRNKTIPPQWRPPTLDENNKRVIFGNPHTWDGISSWKKDKSPDSGMEAPGTTSAVAATAASSVTPAAAAAILTTGQTTAAAAVKAAAAAATAMKLLTTIATDDSTALTSATTLTQDQVNEINRIQANLGNFSTTISDVTSYLATLH